MSGARDSFSLVVLGDLHMEDDMSHHLQARDDCLAALRSVSLLDQARVEELKDKKAGELSEDELEFLLDASRQGDLIDASVASLGDLGRKDIRHEPGDGGTTKCFLDAKAFLDGFHPVPYNIITGNHDLEGLDEFDTDASNLKAWMDVFSLDTPYFSRQIADKTLLVGLSSTRFRDSPFSSHEVYVDPAQVDWFRQTLETHPADQGWRIVVVSHAPPMGAGLRVLQDVHIRNGCAWLNHACPPEEARVFLRLVKQHPQVKAWFSGHFHLSHEFEDSISMVGACTFVQVGVIGPASARDHRRQTRLLQGDGQQLRIFSINHHVRDEATGCAEVRLDATVDLETASIEYAHSSETYEASDWFSAYVPQEADGCYLESPNGRVACAQGEMHSVCWWHMADGKVLGVHDGQIVEYDSETLSPLGIVVERGHLAGREVAVVNEGEAVVLIRQAEGQATPHVEVVHPNDDGTYWRRYQRNKRIRQQEKLREALAKQWLAEQSEQTA